MPPKSSNPNQMQQFASAEYQIIFSAHVLLRLTRPAFKSIHESSQSKQKIFPSFLMPSNEKSTKPLRPTRKMTAQDAVRA